MLNNLINKTCSVTWKTIRRSYLEIIESRY